MGNNDFWSLNWRSNDRSLAKEVTKLLSLKHETGKVKRNMNIQQIKLEGFWTKN